MPSVLCQKIRSISLNGLFICLFFVQDYGWIKSGMIFPFVDYVDRCLIIGFFYPFLLCFFCPLNYEMYVKLAK